MDPTSDDVTAPPASPADHQTQAATVELPQQTVSSRGGFGGFVDGVKADLRSVRAEIAAMSLLGKAAAFLLAFYICAVTAARFGGSWGEWVSEGDWRQWIYQYWRYTEPGTFPPGQWLTDYAFNMQPPFYWAAMATLSTVMVPMKAAVVVNWVSWFMMIFAVVFGVRGRTTLLVGLLAAAILVREIDVFQYTSGGYPRSFGPSITALFLAAFLNNRFKLALFALIFGAGMYPSVVVPCALALGVWTTLSVFGAAYRNDKRAWLMRMVALAGTAVVVAVLGLAQSLTAEDWWGPVVWAKDTGIELTRRGRCNWMPLPDYWYSLLDPLGEIFHRSGWATLSSSPIELPPVGRKIATWGGLVVGVAAGVVVAVRAPRKFPLKLVMMFGAVLVAYFVARELAFKLYLPKRVIQHTLPVVVTFSLTLLVAFAAEALGVARRFQAVVVLVVVALPIFVLTGDGLQGAGVWGDKSRWKEQMNWIRKNTRPTDEFAGDLRTMDWIPLYGQRATYVNFTLGHPFRYGFWDEVEKRTLKAYDAYYATDLEAVLRFMEDESVEYFVVDKEQFKKLNVGFGYLFEPMASEVKNEMFEPRKKVGFALESPPKEIVAYRRSGVSFIERNRLRRYLARTEAAAPPTETAPTETAPTETAPAETAP